MKGETVRSKYITTAETRSFYFFFSKNKYALLCEKSQDVHSKDSFFIS